MKSILRRILYQPGINRVVRTTLKPVASYLPEALRIPVSGTIEVKLWHYGSVRLATNQTNCLTKDVFWGGVQGYEYPSMRLFVELAARSRCFVDIGANIGYYSVVAALVNPDLRVYAFEPAPSIFHYLEKNIQLNGFEDRIRAFPIALAEGAGEIDLFITRNPKAEYLAHHLGGSSNTVRPRDARSRTVKVATSGLNDFAEQYELPDIDLLKMDTEGTEDRVLAGAQAVIERGRPVIFCEVLPGRIEDRLERFCEAHEYVHYLPTVAGLKPVDSLRGHGVAKDFVLVPLGKVSLMAPFVDDDDDRSDGMHASTRQTP